MPDLPVAMPDLTTLNGLDVDDFVAALDGIVENASWVARAAAAERPFADLPALHAALMRAIATAAPATQLDFLNGHPELTLGILASDLSEASLREQGENPLSGIADAGAFEGMLAAYRARFGFPFIVALRRRTPESVLRALAARSQRDGAEEIKAALEEVGHVSRLRLQDRFPGPTRPGAALALLTRAEPDVALDAFRVVLLQEGRPAWSGRPQAKGAVTMLTGPALRVGHYALAVDGWPDASLPRGAAVRFAVQDPDRTLSAILRIGDRSAGLALRD
ncbi:2-oxo-4-hydroxy-4-carboxy-5-ureidoimidazoline decarboxylase [Roseomonas sp. CCTCC AB2023176]|uniref:2-oxo-4-hydroxy-4-carboxy-5-ureidoimidazoline decarboxylase n=1 Tax=Roseomonas sp. CCTCC AB2023176 TaxID=3342640 RepID=UPI0035DB5AEA